MSQEQVKGARYIQLLDQARCDGDWDEVPELIRKIRKHAPERYCLALVAQTEHAVVKATKDDPSSPITLDSTGLVSLTESLSEANGKEETFLEDKFQAQVCLGWIYWIAGETSTAIAKLPKTVENIDQIHGTENGHTGWTKVCALKASYINGILLAGTGAVAEALKGFKSAIPLISSVSPKFGIVGREGRVWAELLLTQFCMLCGYTSQKKIGLLPEVEALSGFRAWASFWEQQFGQAPPPGGIVPRSNILRRHVWREYYVTLSSIIQNNLPFPAVSATTPLSDMSTGLQQRAELQRVETGYEALLMQEVSFPRAEQANDEVEEWADLVMQNWKILCGGSWLGKELGEDGREAVSRRALDSLYRAATRTFHSTLILRHLFTVHLAIAEFDLAFKAFDTYLEIVKNGNAQGEKKNESEHGFDDDEAILRTVSDCIKALCQYGSRVAAEKAKGLADFLEEFLGKHLAQQRTKGSVNGNGRATENEPSSSRGPLISLEGLAIAWRSIGIAQSQWARFTYDAGSRADIQLQAVKSFRRALLPEYEQTDNVNTIFALAMVLAERRELGAAIDIVRTALLPPNTLSGKSDNIQAHYSRFARERSLIPLWHLLALLLSARQEFTTAVRSCEGAFGQFGDSKALFGEAKSHWGYRSEHLNHMEPQPGNEKPHAKGIVDEMDDFEKVAVLEVKMTQLVLFEVLEGPDAAVNASDELLSLYSRLFGEPQSATATPKTSQTTPPKSSTGTLRSLKGSIFGRSVPPTRKSSGTRGRTFSSYTEKALPARPHTSNANTGVAMGAPIIHVTNETNDTAHREKLHKRDPSLVRNRSHGSLRNRSPITDQNLHRTLSAAYGKPGTDNSARLQKKLTISPDNPGLNVKPEHSKLGQTAPQGPSPSQTGQQDPSSKKLPPISQSMSEKVQPLKANSAITRNNRLLDPLSRPLSVNPVTRFPKDQERRLRVSILVKVWLLIAGFYRRAEMYEDAKGAIDEAYKLVEDLEMDAPKDVSSNLLLDNGGLGMHISVEKQWGDVWSERGHLSNAKSSPHVALSDFEIALEYFPDHPSAIVGLSSILLDIYTEALPPQPQATSVVLQDPFSSPSQSSLNASAAPPAPTVNPTIKPSISPPHLGPPGLSTTKSTLPYPDLAACGTSAPDPESSHQPSPTALFDRLAARDRALGLLTGLTKLGTGWNYSDAWFVLARAYEEVGQISKAKEVLWWCVELEEGRAVRDWSSVGAGGYVL